MLDFRVNTFLTVCKTMNYTKAAALLHITQPAVSQHIHYLEDYYKVQLFSSEGKKLYLTPSGELLRQSLSTMKHDDFILTQLLQKTNQKSNKIRIGSTLSIGEYVLSDRILSYVKEHPDLELAFHIDDTKILLNQLQEGTIDLAFVEGFYPEKEFDYLPYRNELFFGVCSREHQFIHSQNPTQIEDLLSETLIIREQGSGTREILEHYLWNYNLTIQNFHHVVEFNNMNMIRNAIQQDCGITFLYETVVRDAMALGNIRKIKLNDLHISRDFSILWAKGSRHATYYHSIAEDLCTPQ